MQAQVNAISSVADIPVLLVDDDASVRTSLSQWLALEDMPVTTCARAEEALKQLDGGFQGVLVTDVKMPKISGLELMREALRRQPELPVILITGHGDVPMAVQAMQEGAYDFLEKPFEPERLEEVVRRARDKRWLQLENERLREQLAEGGLDARLLGNARSIVRLRAQIRQLANTKAHVLIHGESGSGKEVVARCLHDFSSRREQPFVAINCGAISESLLESELFGHEKGAFTGANQRRIGKLEHASGGTLFLDEIESMPLDAQIKLLRALQEHEVVRVGANEPIPVELRIVAASKADLLAQSQAGRFREDLYYRLNVAELHIPPLRERKEDIPLLFSHFCQQAAEVHQCPPRQPGHDELSRLARHDWLGNLRELRNAATRFILNVDSGPVGVDTDAVSSDSVTGGGLNEQVAAYERELIRAALLRHQGNIQAVLKELELPRRTLNQKMIRYSLKREDFIGR